MQSLLEIKIKNNKSNMTKRELEISEWCLNNKPLFQKTSITKLATNIGVSPSSINRWCYKLGFEGYKDFISALKMKNKFDTRYESLISTTSKDILYSIANTESSFRYADLLLVLKEISKRKEIIFYGESFTFIQSEYYARMFQKINIRATVVNVASDISLILPHENPVHIFLSMSGKNPNIKRAYDKLVNNKEIKTFTVSICSNKKSNISDIVNAELHGSFYQSIDIDNYELPLVAKSTTEYILKQLFINTYMEDKEKYEKLINRVAKEKIRSN